MGGSQNDQKEGSKIVSDDIIAGILGFIEPLEKTSYLKGDPRVIHETIFNLRDKHPFLQVFAFSKSDVYPFSRHLERVLSRLQVARLLGMENPDFKRFIVRHKAKQVIRERIHKRFNNEQLNELRKIAKEFGENCLAPSQNE
jgi:hypothetical protein